MILLFYQLMYPDQSKGCNNAWMDKYLQPRFSRDSHLKLYAFIILPVTFYHHKLQIQVSHFNIDHKDQLPFSHGSSKNNHCYSVSLVKASFRNDTKL